MALLLWALFGFFALPPLIDAQPQGGPQKIAPPKWLDDEGKDLFNDLESDEVVYGDAACELREKLLKKMAGKGDKDASEHRARVLLGLGICEFMKESYNIAKRRLESAISEMNLPSEEWMLQNQQVAHWALLKQAANFMEKHEITQAGTALRRAREIIDRNIKKFLKMVHKQMGQQGQQAPPLEAMIDEVPGHGKTGNILPMVVKQVPILQQEFPLAEMAEQALDKLDARVRAFDASLKDKKIRLDTSKGKAKGSLMYVRGLGMDSVVPASRSGAAQELVSAGKIAAALQEEAASAEKGVTLVKRTKEGSGCKEGKGMEKVCKALTSVPDVVSNGFGESRLIVVKAGKQVQLDTCQTNANIGILIAAKEGAIATVAGSSEATTLEKGEPLVVDFCREVTMQASGTVPMLFVQAWHPEFAALERSTELRARSKAFGLSEDDIKAATKAVNDHAKKQWEKSAKLWREGSDWHTSLRQSAEGEETAKQQEAEAAAEAKRKEDEAGDEKRKKNLEELERKRAEKKRKEEEAEQARLRRKKQLEEERANRDPWLNAPSVLEAEKQVEELKEARRDANAKLEFDLSTQLTKDISAAERALKKAIKKAKKDHKKGGTGAESGKTSTSGEVEEKDGSGSEAEQLRKELAKIKEKKKKAAEAEDFAQAKKLKKEQEELEAKLKKLEL